MQITQYFPAVFFRLPHGAMDALLQAAVRALSLQERYSLVAATSYLVSLKSYRIHYLTCGPGNLH